MIGRFLAGIVYLASFLVAFAFILLWNGIQALLRALLGLSRGASGAAASEHAAPRTWGTSQTSAPSSTGQEAAVPGGQAHTEAPAFFTTAQASEQPGDPIQAAEQAPPPEAPVRPRRVHRPRHEERWIGTLVEHGVGEFTDRASGRKYSSYYVRLDTDAGDVITRRGVELEQAIQFAGANRGDRIELFFLGREPVEMQDSDPARRKWRNRWRIHVIK